MVMIGIERGFQNGVFSGLRFGQGLFQFQAIAYFTMDNGQGRGPIAVGRFHPQHGGLDIDELAVLQVAQAAGPFPLAGFIDRRHGRVAELDPRFGIVKVAQIGGRYFLLLRQSQHPPAGRIQIKRLPVRCGQANEIVDPFSHGQEAIREPDVESRRVWR